MNVSVINSIRIGGQMGLAPSDLGLCEKGLEFPYENYSLVATGRTAIRTILETLELGAGARALLPSYLCPSVVQPFEELQLSIAYFPIRRNLEIDVEGLLAAAASARPDVVLFINYFGFPVSDTAAAVLTDLKRHSWVIEDCVQGSLVETDGPVVGGIGHFAFTSFRKFTAAPDGALIIGPEDTRLPRLDAGVEGFSMGSTLGKVVRSLGEGAHSGGLESFCLDLFASVEQEIDRSVPMRGMSSLARHIYMSTDLRATCRRRRLNFELILKAFQEQREVSDVGESLCRSLPEGVSPLAFPICVERDRRDRLQAALVEKDVFCPVHWKLPGYVDGAFDDSHVLSECELSLPIDQRYGAAEIGTLLERLVEAHRSIAPGR